MILTIRRLFFPPTEADLADDREYQNGHPSLGDNLPTSIQTRARETSDLSSDDTHTLDKLESSNAKMGNTLTTSFKVILRRQLKAAGLRMMINKLTIDSIRIRRSLLRARLLRKMAKTTSRTGA